MTKNELINFIENNYTDDENLLWQVVSKSDIDPFTGVDLTDDDWDDFVRQNESYSVLADSFTNDVVAGVQEWVLESK